MKIGIMQPYFMPYIGYFQLMKIVDQYVIYDDVNFIKGGWISRNNLLIGGEKKMFTVMLKGASPNKLINEIEIGDDFRKFQKTLSISYTKAPYIKDVTALIEKIVAFEDKNLAKFIGNSFKEILAYLQIDTKLIFSSDLNKNVAEKGVDKVISICKLLGGDTYINAIGGKELYDKGMFKENGLNLSFLQTDLVSYKQFSENFTAGLSILDVLMFNSVEETNNLLNKFTLV